MLFIPGEWLQKVQTDDLQNVNTTYNNTTTSANSQDIYCGWFKTFRLSYTRDSAGVGAHAIQFIIQSKDAAGNYFDMLDDAWGLFKMEDTTYVAALNESYSGNLKGLSTIRIRVVASGTTASLTFIVSNMKLEFQT